MCKFCFAGRVKRPAGRKLILIHLQSIKIRLMKKSVVFFCILASGLAFSFRPGNDAPQKAKLVEKIEKKGSELVIPYEKYVLPNGLTLVVHEDHSDPVVYVDVTYHVGSNREDIGRSGFAHFFEHMMFQGSEHVGDEQHFKIVSEAGGTLNGSTTLDRTNYFETLPSNQLEVALWLEADRMGFLLDSVTQKKFEVQRATVKNERGQRVDNVPYGQVNERVNEAIYPENHPYHWPTIGWIEDLNRVDVNDLKRFFMRWYGPNNATLTVAGDVKPQDVVKMAEKYFGPIPRGPEVKNLAKMNVTLDKDRYISYEDKIKFPLLQLSYPTVNNYHPDEAPLDVLADILGGGKTSLFYKNFVKTQKALRANVFHPSAELSGSFVISVMPLPGKTLAQMDSLVRASLAEFEKRGVTDDDLAKYKASHESDVINSLATVQGKGTQLAAYQTFLNNPGMIGKDLERYMKVTKEDVMRVYNTYIKGKGAVVMSVYPKGKPELVAKPDSYKAPARPTTGVESAEYKNLSYNKAKDNFDRSKKPAPGPNPSVHVPDFWTESFANGLKAIGTRSSEIPTATVELSVQAGHRYEDLSKAGLSQLTSSMLNAGTTSHTEEEISQMLEKLGSTISFRSGNEEITMTISSLTKNMDATLKIAEEMLTHPKFAQEDFDRLKKQQTEGINNQTTQPMVIATNVFSKVLYGDKHIMSTPVIGSLQTVQSLTLDDVKSFYANFFSPSVSRLVVVGDVSKDEILPKLGFLKSWARKEVKTGPEPTTPQIGKTKVYFVNKEKAAQSEIRIGYIGIPYDATGEFWKTTIMNYALGAAFNSRINLNLREDKGWTYGAHSYFTGTKYAGPFLAAGGIKAGATDSAVTEFMKEIKNYATTGIKADELDFTKKSIGQSDALKYEAPWQKSGFLKRILDYDLAKDFVDKQNAILQGITKQEVDAIAKKMLPYNNLVIVVVGDKARYWEPVKKLGYEVIELDAEGKEVKAQDKTGSGSSDDIGK